MGTGLFSLKRKKEQPLGLHSLGEKFPQTPGENWQSVPLTRNQIAYYCSGSDELRIFNRNTQTTLVAKDPSFKNIAFVLTAAAEDGARLFVVSPEKIYLWNEKGGFVFSLPSASRTKPAVSPNGNCVAALSQNGNEVALETIHLQSLDSIAVSSGHLMSGSERQLNGDVNDFSLALTNQHIFVSSPTNQSFVGVYAIRASDFHFDPEMTNALAAIFQSSSQFLGAFEDSQGKLMVVLQQPEIGLTFYEMKEGNFVPISVQFSNACEEVQMVQPDLLLLKTKNGEQNYLLHLSTFETVAVPQNLKFSCDGFAFDFAGKKLFELSMPDAEENLKLKR